jgi:Superinfection immunity protein
MPPTLLSVLAPSTMLSSSFLAITYAAFPVILILYFLPTVIARRRGIRNDGLVILVNLFLGWTLIGWLFALAWAAVEEAPPRHA